jgi:hypothetical protein
MHFETPVAALVRFRQYRSGERELTAIEKLDASACVMGVPVCNRNV